MAKDSPARKQRLRDRAREASDLERQKCAVLKARGNSCSTCAHKGKRSMDAELICELDSDFYGYRRVPQTYVCSRFKHQS